MRWHNLFMVTALLMPASPASAYEEPAYRVSEKNEHFEVRDYAPQLVAETRVTAPFEQAGSMAFSILAGYIFGNNRGQQKIDMTAPVNQSPAGEKIEMTAPVAQTPDAAAADTYVFSFVMPARYTVATLPQPLDPRVEIRAVPARRMAVLRFSGTWSEARYREHEARLLAAVDAAKLTTAGKPVFARYNPPLMPWFLRRNEVMIEVRP